MSAVNKPAAFSRWLLLVAAAAVVSASGLAVHAQELLRCVSSQAGDRLTWQAPLSFMSAAPTNGQVFQVDDSATFQTMAGFGGSFMEAGMICLNSLPTNQQTALLAALFDPDQGAGFSVMKTPIAATDFMSAGPFYSYNDVPGDVTMTDFSIARDLGTNGVISLIRAARRHGHFVLQASMDYPPDWMLYDVDSDQDVNPAYYDALARYYLRYLQEYEEHGIHIDYLSLFNEPGIYTKIPYTGIRDLLKNHVGPMLKLSGVQTKIMLSEAPIRYAAWANYSTVLDDPDARQYVEVLPYHGYDFGHFDLIAALHANYPAFPLWMTEVCYTYLAGFPPEIALPRYDFEDGSFWGHQIMSDLEAGASAWIYWNIILNQNGGPWLVSPIHADPNPNVQHPLVIVNRDTKEVTYTGCYYYLAHFSKFIRPNSVRVKVTGSINNARCVTFKLPTGKMAAQIMNTSDLTNIVTLAFGDRFVALALPPISITTAIWSLAEFGRLPLSIQTSNDTVIIEWAMGCTNCQLLESTSLHTGASWTRTEGASQLVNGRYHLEVPLSGNSRFYRLLRP